MVFGFDNNFSVIISPALTAYSSSVTPEGVSLLAKGIKRHKNRKKKWKYHEWKQFHVFNLFKP